jgi:hypothetical protein
MNDMRDLLDRAGSRAPSPDFDLDALRRRRDRARERDRIGAIILGLTLAVVAIGGAFIAFRPQRGIAPAAAGGTTVLPPPTRSALEAGPGEYYFTHVHMLLECPAGQESYCGSPSTTGIDRNELDARFWWRSDEAGRIEVNIAHNYGIDGGAFGPGDFPNHNGIDVSIFPSDPERLTEFLLARSQPDGSSPAPLVTPPPEGAPEDGRMWRAITDLLQNPQVTPEVRAALLEVAAELQGSHVELGATDPTGRPAYVISFGNWGGDLIERLYVDPASHDLLAWTQTAEIGDTPFMTWLIESAGLAASTDEGPQTTSIPSSQKA